MIFCTVWVFTWVHPCHPHSQWGKSRDLGKAWLTLSNEPRMPTLHRAIMTSSKAFVGIIIATVYILTELCSMYMTCTFNVCHRQESHHQCNLQVAQGLVLVRFVPLCKLQLCHCCLLLLLVLKMVLTLCNLRWWCFFQSSTSAITLLALMIIACNLHWWHIVNVN